MVFKSGYIALIGRPNVGKSTLLNALVGESVAIVTPKPQTTRNRILGIKNLPGAQLLFLDTPGIHKPHRDLNQFMVEAAKASLSDADLVLLVLEPKPLSGEERQILKLIEDQKKPYLVVINKVDSISKDLLIPLLMQFQKEFPFAKGFVPIAAIQEDGVDRLLDDVVAYLPEGPAYFPEDSLTDQTERFLVSEIIREQVMTLTKEEVPYSVAVTIDEYVEPSLRAGGEGGLSSAEKPTCSVGGEQRRTPPRQDPLIRITATIHVEKDSQKGIIIGARGQMIKNIGEAARKKMETTLDSKVFLKLFVRVTSDWSHSSTKMKELGYG